MDEHNTAASVKQRLLNIARQERRPLNELLQFYVMERFLFRLSESPYRDDYILKGALLLRVWEMPEARPTMDIDLLGSIRMSVEQIQEQLSSIMNMSVADDGLRYDTSTLVSTPIDSDAEYTGYRFRCRVFLDTARIPLQIDIGQSDVVYPESTLEPSPVLLHHQAPLIRCYPRESIIAEKYQAMVHLGDINSRMKDFFDIWYLCQHFQFDREILAEAISRTFQQRTTEIVMCEKVFTAAFLESRKKLWNIFHKRLGMKMVPEEFKQLLQELSAFLSPVLNTLRQRTKHRLTWPPKGPWQNI